INSQLHRPPYSLGFAAIARGALRGARRSFLVQSPSSFEGAEVRNSERISSRCDHGEQRFGWVKCHACRWISPGQAFVFFVKHGVILPFSRSQNFNPNPTPKIPNAMIFRAAKVAENW